MSSESWQQQLKMMDARAYALGCRLYEEGYGCPSSMWTVYGQFAQEKKILCCPGSCKPGLDDYCPGGTMEVGPPKHMPGSTDTIPYGKDAYTTCCPLKMRGTQFVCPPGPHGEQRFVGPDGRCWSKEHLGCFFTEFGDPAPECPPGTYESGQPDWSKDNVRICCPPKEAHFPSKEAHLQGNPMNNSIQRNPIYWRCPPPCTPPPCPTYGPPWNDGVDVGTYQALIVNGESKPMEFQAQPPPPSCETRLVTWFGIDPQITKTIWQSQRFAYKANPYPYNAWKNSDPGQTLTEWFTHVLYWDVKDQIVAPPGSGQVFPLIIDPNELTHTEAEALWVELFECVKKNEPAGLAPKYVNQKIPPAPGPSQDPPSTCEDYIGSKNNWRTKTIWQEHPLQYPKNPFPYNAWKASSPKQTLSEWFTNVIYWDAFWATGWGGPEDHPVQQLKPIKIDPNDPQHHSAAILWINIFNCVEKNRPPSLDAGLPQRQQVPQRQKSNPGLPPDFDLPDASAPPDFQAPVVLDVRTEPEFRAGHLPGARSIPVDEMAERLEEVAEATGGDFDKKVCVYCCRGAKAEQAAEFLRALGFTDVTNLGGLETSQGVGRSEVL